MSLQKLNRKLLFFHAERKMLMKKNRQRKMKLIPSLSGKARAKYQKKNEFFTNKTIFFHNFSSGAGKKKR